METSAIFTIALSVTLFALVSRRAEAGMVTAPMVFTAFGFLMGGAVLGLFKPSLQSEGIEVLAEITLVVALFTDAARIDLRRLGREHDLPLRLLAIGLPLTVIAGTGLAMLLFPALGLWSAALIAVMLAPTDAALGQAVVSDRRVPQRVRQALNVESGLDDGLAFPALLFVASLAGAGAVADLGVGGVDTGAADWAVFITEQLIFGPLVGIGVGLGGAMLVERANARNWMNEISSFEFLDPVARDPRLHRRRASGRQRVHRRLRRRPRGRHTLAPGSRRGGGFRRDRGPAPDPPRLPPVRGGAPARPRRAGLATSALRGALSLTVVRAVPVALSLTGARLAPSTVLFLGWFGPRGLASIIYLLLVLESGAVPGADEIRRVVFLTVVLSVVLHGGHRGAACRALRPPDIGAPGGARASAGLPLPGPDAERAPESPRTGLMTKGTTRRPSASTPEVEFDPRRAPLQRRDASGHRGRWGSFRRKRPLSAPSGGLCGGSAEVLPVPG